MLNQESFVRIVLLVALLIVGVKVAHAHDGPNGCYPTSVFNRVVELSSYSQFWSDGSWDVYICDDVAQDRELMGTSEAPGMLTNQVWSVLSCGDMVMKIWVVNCNEA